MGEIIKPTMGTMEKAHGGRVRFSYDFQQWKCRKPQAGIVHELMIRLRHPIRYLSEGKGSSDRQGTTAQI